jgi:hypothetical protein
MTLSLKEKIRQRRLKAGIVPGSAHDTHKKHEPTLPLGERINKIAETIKLAKYNHLEIAEELNSILSDGKFSQIDLANKLQKTQGWISGKIALLSADPEVQNKIKKGELAASTYYKSSIGHAKKLTITRKQANGLARDLRDIAAKYGINILLSKKPTKAEVLTVFSRSKDIKRAVLG